MATRAFQPIHGGERLSERVARELAAEIRTGRLAAGAKLPAESRLVEQFQVSRTVVREAVSRLKSVNLVASRQGSGVYVSSTPLLEPLNFDGRHATSRDAVAQLAEVRRALEAEAAALAAARRTTADLRRIRQAIGALDKAVRAGGGGVEEDLAFHRAVAEAAHNPFLMGTLDYLARFMREAIGVTRANEARRVDFMKQVRQEHQAVADAVEAADAATARRAAARHMANSIKRIAQADATFWGQQQGLRMAEPLPERG